METGKDKVKKICDLLKKETLEPAYDEASKIVSNAQEQAKKIIHDASKEAKKTHELMKQELESEKNVFVASLKLAYKQVIDSIKQEIENKLFNPALLTLIQKESAQPHALAEIISALVKAIEKEGLDAKLAALIPSSVATEAVNALVGKEILEKLEKESVELGDQAGGAKVKIKDRHMTLDMSDETLELLISNYIREDFRELIFKS